MKKIYFLFALMVGEILAGGLPVMTVPIRIDSALIPKVRYIDQNNDSIKSWSRIVTDTLNRRSDTVAYYLDNSGGITGTGQLVRSASPTLTGTANVANMVFSGTLTTNALTASLPVFTNGSKQFASNAITGTGNVVMSSSASVASMTLTNPAIQGSSTLSGTLTGGTVNSTTLQQGGVQAVTTSGTQTLTNKSISASQITSGSFPSGVYAFPSDVDVAGGIALRSNTILRNKADDGWVTVFTRNTAGSEAVYDANNIGTLYTTGRVGVGTTFPDSSFMVNGSGNFAGNVKIGGNLNLAGTMNSNSTGFYEEGTFTINYSSGFTTTVSGTVSFTRVGKMVTLKFPVVSGTSNQEWIISGDDIPARLRPTSTIATNANSLCIDAGTTYNSTVDGVGCLHTIIISSSGSVSNYLIQKGTTPSQWTASGTKGFNSWGFIVSYQLN